MKRLILTGSTCLLLWVVGLTLLQGCSPTPEKPSAYTVEIKDMKFVPEDITVKKGDTITFINRDIVAHDVTEETSKLWSSGKMETGAVWKLVVKDTADYFCSIHTVMKGRIELE